MSEPDPYEWDALKKQAQALLNVRTAWELYRSGGATLEEITPLMDEAVAEAELAQISVSVQGGRIPVVEAKSPAGNNVLPRELAKIGQMFKFDGKFYRVKSFDAQYAVLDQVDRDGTFVSDGSPRGKLSIRVEGTVGPGGVGGVLGGGMGPPKIDIRFSASAVGASKVGEAVRQDIAEQLRAAAMKKAGV
jgi:hypothetical protein